MEINVTHYAEHVDCSMFSASIAETGREDIGRITWENAMNHVQIEGLVTPEQQGELREWLADFGAWSIEEIEAMSDQETDALLLQFVASAIREYRDAEDHGELASYLENHGGQLYRDESGQWWFYVGD